MPKHANEEFLLLSTDWSEEWKRLQVKRERYDDPGIWNERAKTFSVKHGLQEGYVARFLELMGIESGETVLDMGCGTGALATPLAKAGHEVIACDFSRGMLDVMLEDQRNLGMEPVSVKLLSWSDDWDAEGVGENYVDFAIASRSIATDDIKTALLKLDRVARRRVCVTLPCSASPKADDELLAAAGFPKIIGRDFLYAFNILVQLGIRPEVSYIDNGRIDAFETFDDALRAYSEIAKSAARGIASEEEMTAVPNRLRPWLEEHLVNEDGHFMLDHVRPVKWAFLAWETSR